MRGRISALSNSIQRKSTSESSAARSTGFVCLVSSVRNATPIQTSNFCCVEFNSYTDVINLLSMRKFGPAEGKELNLNLNILYHVLSAALLLLILLTDHFP